MMPLTEVVGWAGNVLFLLGGIMLAARDRGGFLLHSVANGCYIVYSVLSNGLALCVLSVALGIMGVWNYFVWKEKPCKR